ncbi:MAG: hypothetical protein U5L74_00455 [Ideonella sp.]|nr:hypothetical protein [Ideonella sp.]
MIPLAQRQTLLGLIQAACTSGARLAQACKIVGLSTRSVQRWLHPDGADGDQRESGKRKAVEPANKLSAQECADVMATLNSEEFKDLPPSQVVPRLSDQGRYLASESTMYRLLKNAHQLGHRRLQAVPQKRSKPRALVASQPNQVYCWDITYLPSQVRGQHFYRTSSKTSSAARSWAGKSSTARARSWLPSCCAISVSAKASARTSSRCIPTMAHP